MSSFCGVYNKIMSFISLQHTKLDPVLVMQPHTTLQLQNIVLTKRQNSLLSFWMPFECPLELPLQMTIPLNYLTLTTSVFLECIVNIQIQAVFLQIIMVQLRAINNIWKGTECWLPCCKSVIIVLGRLSIIATCIQASFLSAPIMSSYLLVGVCVVADWITLNITENHCVKFTCTFN